MSEHWHHCSWEIDRDRPVTPFTSVSSRPRIPIGATSIIDEPDSPMWRDQGHGGYRAVSGAYEFAHVVWRCTDRSCMG